MAVGDKFDNRTTREVEASRNMINRKPWRTHAQKELARKKAIKVDGRWCSSVPTNEHTK